MVLKSGQMEPEQVEQLLRVQQLIAKAWQSFPQPTTARELVGTKDPAAPSETWDAFEMFEGKPFNRIDCSQLRRNISAVWFLTEEARRYYVSSFVLCTVSLLLQGDDPEFLPSTCAGMIREFIKSHDVADPEELNRVIALRFSVSVLHQCLENYMELEDLQKDLDNGSVL